MHLSNEHTNHNWITAQMSRFSLVALRAQSTRAVLFQTLTHLGSSSSCQSDRINGHFLCQWMSRANRVLLLLAGERSAIGTNFGFARMLAGVLKALFMSERQRRRRTRARAPWSNRTEPRALRNVGPFSLQATATRSAERVRLVRCLCGVTHRQNRQRFTRECESE